MLLLKSVRPPARLTVRTGKNLLANRQRLWDLRRAASRLSRRTGGDDLLRCLLRLDLLDQSFQVGADPRAVAFDGANIWVANLGSENVTRISLVK